MKKTLFAFAALLAIAAVACQKEMAAPEDSQSENQTAITPGETHNGKGTVVFTARVSNDPASRTSIGAADGSGKYQLTWADTDSIVVNGVKSSHTEILDGGRTAKFTVEGVEAPFKAMYPGAKLKNLVELTANSYSFLVSGAGSPQIYQDPAANEGNPTFDPKQATLAAYSASGEDLTFHHICVYYRITVDAGTSADPDPTRYVYVRNGDGSLNAGTWKVTYTDENNISVQPGDDPEKISSVVTLDCGDGGVAQGTPMIIAIPAYNYSTGLIITIKDVNGHFCSYQIKSTATQFASQAGAIIDFNATFSPGAGTINSAEDWEAFAAAVNSPGSCGFKLYRWVGNGTVNLGTDINTTKLTKITGKFPYTFDGQNHTITCSAAEGPLFRNVRGTVKNLNVAGAIESTSHTCGAIADTLYTGGKIIDCTSAMNISVNSGTLQTGSRAGGIVGIMTGGTIYGCTNTGSVYSSVDCSGKEIYNLQIGGIVGQVDGTNATSGDAILQNCTNSGAITADPISSSNHVYAVTYTGIGGIAGWLRGKAHSFILTNCDNSGPITYSAEHVTDPTGTKAKSISAGGIVGIAGDHAGNNGFNSSVGENGLDVTIRYCDNSGTIHNCGINYATTKENNKRVYTGGITGALVGTSSKFARMASCTSTGDILTYDLTGTGSSTRPLYCQVAGGLIGYGGYIAVDSCKVNCTIGNGKRPSTAVGGAIGCAMAPFSADRDTVWVQEYCVRLNPGNQLNSATFAVVSKTWSSTAVNVVPNINGSSLTNCRLGGTLYYCDVATAAAATSTNDQSANCTNTVILGAVLDIDNPKAIRGQGYNDGETIRADVSYSNNVTISVAP